MIRHCAGGNLTHIQLPSQQPLTWTALLSLNSGLSTTHYIKIMRSLLLTRLLLLTRYKKTSPSPKKAGWEGHPLKVPPGSLLGFIVTLPFFPRCAALFLITTFYLAFLWENTRRDIQSKESHQLHLWRFLCQHWSEEDTGKGLCFTPAITIGSISSTGSRRGAFPEEGWTQHKINV